MAERKGDEKLHNVPMGEGFFARCEAAAGVESNCSLQEVCLPRGEEGGVRGMMQKYVPKCESGGRANTSFW